MVSIKTGMMQYKKWQRGLLRPDGKPGFDTPSGKFEIASSVLEEYGYDPLPVYAEPGEGPLSRPDLAKEYPLVFNSGARVNTSFHTQHHGIENLSRNRPEPAVTINNEDAGERGIRNGDLVRIKTVRGSMTMRARVTEDMARGSIDANHACGSPVGPEAWKKRNVNYLTDLNQYDPISGFPVYKCLLCDVLREDGGSDAVIIDSGEMDGNELHIDNEIPGRKEIYLDHNATTPLDPAVKEVMTEAMDCYGNASSIHAAGKRSHVLIEHARRSVAHALKTTARRIVFTGSGSEADNLAIKGIAFANRQRKDHIITSAIEHHAVLNSCRWLESHGFQVTYLGVDRNGRVDPNKLQKAITDRTCLISIMTANNETGVIQPIQDLARIAKERNVLFHSDAVQAFGKIPVDVEKLGVDLLSVSAHKLYGPKGVGALYVRKGVPLESLINGGGHEHGIRAGTENVVGIAGFGKAAELLPRFLERTDHVHSLRDRMEKGIGEIIEDCRVNGQREIRIPNTLNMTLPGFRGESLVLAMQRYGVCFSSGSACRSGSPDPSHVLLAMGLSEEEAHCSLRFSLGCENTVEDVEQTIEYLSRTIRDSKSMVHFVPCR